MTIRPLVFLTAAFIVSAGFAQSPDDGKVKRDRGYDGFDSLAESHQRGDARRRWEVGRQMALIQEQRRWNGLPATVPLVPTGPNRVSFYAYGNRWDLSRCGTVFEPWPYVPGYIWGYRFDDPAPQPIDRRQVQTAPNRWVSYPVYPGEAVHAQEPVQRERVNREPVEDEQLEPVPPPPVPKRSGPRRY